MIRVLAAAAIVCSLSLSGCEALKTVTIVNDPNADAGNKVCAMLAWGIPLAESRLGTLGPRGVEIVAYAKQVVAAGCRADDATWRERAMAAATELSYVLWGLVR